ncbi:hypothetical protein D6T65_01645 [Arthrobacter frigidicola]|nr:hypothetical protein D6T65_01645 [Arthrobacter frigidicola]
MTAPARLLQSLPQGTRVVVRYRIGAQLTDALGDLIAINDDSCTVRTRRGDAVVPLSDVTAAKPVPPAPPRRAPRVP